MADARHRLAAGVAQSRQAEGRDHRPTGFIATMRFNQLHPPFNNPAMRRAMVHAVTQADYMMAWSAPIRRCGTRRGVFLSGHADGQRCRDGDLTGPRDIRPRRWRRRDTRARRWWC